MRIIDAAIECHLRQVGDRVPIGRRKLDSTGHYNWVADHTHERQECCRYVAADEPHCYTAKHVANIFKVTTDLAPWLKLIRLAEALPYRIDFSPAVLRGMEKVAIVHLRIGGKIDTRWVRRTQKAVLRTLIKDLATGAPNPDVPWFPFPRRPVQMPLFDINTRAKLEETWGVPY